MIEIRSNLGKLYLGKREVTLRAMRIVAKESIAKESLSIILISSYLAIFSASVAYVIAQNISFIGIMNLSSSLFLCSLILISFFEMFLWIFPSSSRGDYLSRPNKILEIYKIRAMKISSSIDLIESKNLFILFLFLILAIALIFMSLCVFYGYFFPTFCWAFSSILLIEIILIFIFIERHVIWIK